MIWVPDIQLAKVLGAREASEFESVLRSIAAESRDVDAATASAAHRPG